MRYKLSFTEEKFYSLSRDNRIKKVIFAIREYLFGRKDISYTAAIIGWLQHYEKDITLSSTDEINYPQLLKQLIDLLQQENPFTEVYPLDREESFKVLDIAVILNNIRSPYNVGAIIRNCDAFGVKEVIMTGFTPIVADNKLINKTARYASISSSYQQSIIETICNLKAQNYLIIALEKTVSSKDIRVNIVKLPLALILGNEEFGVDKEVLQLCDHIVHIPLYGTKNSLNVSVACGIALYQLVNTYQIAN